MLSSSSSVLLLVFLVSLLWSSLDLSRFSLSCWVIQLTIGMSSSSDSCVKLLLLSSSVGGVFTWSFYLFTVGLRDQIDNKNVFFIGLLCYVIILLSGQDHSGVLKIIKLNIAWYMIIFMGYTLTLPMPVHSNNRTGPVHSYYYVLATLTKPMQQYFSVSRPASRLYLSYGPI